MRLVVLLAAVVLALSGCAPSDPTVVDGSHRLVVATGEPSVIAGTGLIGTVGYDAAGCVVLGTDIVLVAPPGSTLRDGVMTLQFGASQKVRVTIGKRTSSLGGSVLSADSPYIPFNTQCSSKKYMLLD